MLAYDMAASYARGIRAFFLILCQYFTPACNAEPGYPSRVVGIIDGDTLTVLTARKEQVKIRLWGIDAPESGQDFGQRAKQATSDLASGKEVTVCEVDTDRHGRVVAEVILPGDKSLNRELVGRWMAWWYRQFAPGDKEFTRLEAEAKAFRRGLWAQPNPISPWDWRRGVGVPVTAGVVGNRNSRVFHAPNCLSVSRMKEANRIVFGTAAEAEKMGYRRAGDCR